MLLASGFIHFLGSTLFKGCALYFYKIIDVGEPNCDVMMNSFKGGGNCYWISTEKKNWDSAGEECERNSSYLAEPLDDASATLVQNKQSMDILFFN